MTGLNVEINEEIIIYDKLFTKFKKSKLETHNQTYNRASNHIQSTIKREKKHFIV